MRLILIIYFLIPFLLISQVGIGTENPTQTLDIDGQLRIRNTPINNNGAFLVVDSDGNVGEINPSHYCFMS